MTGAIRDTVRMTSDLDRLMSLWDFPPGPGAEAAFAGLYADPFVLNGTGTHRYARGNALAGTRSRRAGLRRPLRRLALKSVCCRHGGNGSRVARQDADRGRRRIAGASR